MFHWSMSRWWVGGYMGGELGGEQGGELDGLDPAHIYHQECHVGEGGAMCSLKWLGLGPPPHPGN